jgi:hypothetical protein
MGRDLNALSGEPQRTPQPARPGRRHREPLSARRLYLPADPHRGHLRAWSDLLRPLPLEQPAGPDFSADLKRIEEFVGAGFAPAGWRGLAVFSSARLGLWQACPLPEPVKAVLRVADRPYLTPLLSIADQHRRFGVVLASERRARFLEIFLNQVQEFTDLAMNMRGLGPAHAGAIAETLDGLARNQEFGRIVLGAAPAVCIRLASHLRTDLQQKLIFDESLSPDTEAAAVLARISSCEGEARKVRESVLAHRLIDLAAAGGPAVLGLERTLQALRRGQARLILVRDEFAKMGRLCPRCGELSLDMTRCQACGAATRTVFNLIEEMLQRALDSRCEVLRCLHRSPLDNVGHIGAELLREGPTAG